MLPVIPAEGGFAFEHEAICARNSITKTQMKTLNTTPAPATQITAEKMARFRELAEFLFQIGFRASLQAEAEKNREAYSKKRKAA